jgi:hypothetical protein
MINITGVASRQHRNRARILCSLPEENIKCLTEQYGTSWLLKSCPINRVVYNGV